MPLQDTDVKQITSRLDTVIKLMAALLARDLNNNEAIIKLGKMQLSRELIADALGITTANVAQVIYVSKKTDKKPEKKAKDDGAPMAGAPADRVAAGEVQQ